MLGKPCFTQTITVRRVGSQCVLAWINVIFLTFGLCLCCLLGFVPNSYLVLSLLSVLGQCVCVAVKGLFIRCHPAVNQIPLPRLNLFIYQDYDDQTEPTLRLVHRSAVKLKDMPKQAHAHTRTRASRRTRSHTGHSW